MSENQMFITIIGPGIENKSRSTVEIRGMQIQMGSAYTVIVLHFNANFF